MDVDPELKNYVKEMRDNGFSDEEARKKLKDAGWDPGEVDAALGIGTVMEAPAMPDRPAPPTGQPSGEGELGVFALLEKALNFMSSEMHFWMPFFLVLFALYAGQQIISSILAYGMVGFIPISGLEGLSQSFSVAQSSSMVGYNLLNGILSLIISIAMAVVELGLIKGVAVRLTGKEFSLSEGLAVGKNKIVSAVVAGFFFILLMILGMFLLIIPGVYVLVACILFFPAIAIGDKGVFSSLAESRRLIKGRWWKSLGLGVMYFLCMMAYMIPAMIIIFIATLLFTAIGMLLGPLVSSILTQIVSTAVTLPVTIFMFILMAMFYLNLKENTPETA